VTNRTEATPGDEATIHAMSEDPALKSVAQQFFEQTIRFNYSYNFTWLGLPIIQYPQDVLALQEIIWKTKPDLIVETGIARGGSIVFSASMLQLLGEGKVIGIDIDIREHNRTAIERHPLFSRIEMIQGSSVDPTVVAEVKKRTQGARRIMVILDSNHSAAHVTAELEAYAQLVTPGCYLSVMDTVVERLPQELSFGRPWGPGDSPMTAVDSFLAENKHFAIDASYDRKLLISVAPRGYLIRTQ
jgi:cephalosporin hydroxylase